MREYIKLTKPGIIRGNLITALAGFLLAAKGHVDIQLLLSVLAGVTFVIASGCIFNNLIDRNIDNKMKRTGKRALVTGRISLKGAFVFGTILGVGGFLLLGLFVNILTSWLGMIAFIDYVFLYALAKRHSVHGTLVGTIAGAMPITAGYTAVTNRLDAVAVSLFLVLVCWQMVHFYAIGIYRLKDYTSAGLPILPVVKGIRTTRIQMFVYWALFTAACGWLAIVSDLSKVYMVVMTIVCVWWGRQILEGLKPDNERKWARKIFINSLHIIMIFSLLLAVDNFLQ